MEIEDAVHGHSTIFPNETRSLNVEFEKLKNLIWPVSSEVGRQPPRKEGYCPIANKFYELSLEYPDEIIARVSESKPEIKVGERFDILSLLSCNGKLNYLVRNYSERLSDSKKRPLEERVVIENETFKDKYIILCCFHGPFFREDFTSTTLQGLVSICSDLYKKGDFEVVVVAKMKIDSLEVFDHFLSGFPSSCLVVPFADSECRDFICRSVDLFLSSIQCLIVDKDDKRTVLLHQHPYFAQKHAADAFPFSKERCYAIEMADHPRWKSPSTSSLMGLLNCKPTDVMYNINGEERVSISELKDKVVGLYLCVGVDDIDKIHDIYKQCRARQLLFEVVVVFLSFLDCLDPLIHQANMLTVLQEKNISSWWLWPLDNSVCRRLWRLISLGLDKLVILEPHREFADPYGLDVIRAEGIEAYPFSKEALVQCQLRKMRALTLDSLLVRGSRDYVLRGKEKIPVEKLKGKNVLAYLGCVDDFDLHGKVLYWYHKIKAVDPYFEVVFVRRYNCTVDGNEILYTSSREDGDDSLLPPGLPWLVCPFDPDHTKWVARLILTPGTDGTLVLFRQDGQISSFKAQELLTRHGPEAFPFADDKLRQEAVSHIRVQYDFMHDFEQ